MSILLGFYLGLHDSSIAVAVDGVVKYAKSERITGIKHHRADIDFITKMCSEWGVDSVDAVAFSDGNRNGLGSCEIGELWCEIEPVLHYFSVPTFCLDHHFCHILSAWPLVDLDEVDVGFVIDGRGDNEVRRSVISNPGSSRPQYLYHDKNPSIGNALEAVGHFMELKGCSKFDVDLAGKVMGAQAYGDIKEDYIKSIDIENIGSNYQDLFYSIPWNNQIPANSTGFCDFENQNFRDWLSTVHRIMELETLYFFHKYANHTDKIIYSGGCAQNVVCNETLISNFSNLMIPPHSYDGGLSLGAIEFLRILRNEAPFSKNGFPYWQNDNESEDLSLQTIKNTAKLLAEGKIVGWFQGRSAVGPRALGNRSILMNPTIKDGKNIINRRVKHRESWRPYGASIDLKYAPEWFNIIEESPFMLRSVEVNPDRKKIIPAVTHVDGTCRIQTVNSTDNVTFLELINEFNDITGIPLLLNTSLNGGGQPIYSSREQCLSLLRNADLDVVVIGNSTYLKK